MLKRVNLIISIKEIAVRKNYAIVSLIHFQLAMLEMSFKVQNFDYQSFGLGFKLTDLHCLQLHDQIVKVRRLD